MLTVSVVASYSLMPFINSAIADAAPTNLIANPLVETTNPSNASQPLDWQTGNWGTNTTTFSYLSSGSTGDTKSVSVNTTAYSSGDAKWYFNPVSVIAGSEYSYSDAYQSTTASEIDVAFVMTDGTTQYVDLGDPAAASTWQQFSANFTAPTGVSTATVYHLINSVGSLTTDNFSLSSTSAPTVSITAPVTNATVSGNSVSLSADASDSNGISSVQFQIDGLNIGAAVTTSPYQYTWDSTTISNGTHSLTAVATNSEGITTTSSPIQITINNPIAPGTNLIANPLVETTNPSNASQPLDWQTGNWGTNTTTFSYLSSGSTGDTKSVSVNTTAYSSGDAKWYFNPVSVIAGQTYNFSDYYKSTIITQTFVAYTLSGGAMEYISLGNVAASATWTQYSTSFTVPTGVISATIYHVISGVGSLTTDAFSLATSTLPSATITSPTASTPTSTPLSGSITLDATASDNSGVKNVQFQIDDKNVGSADSVAPYSYVWNSASTTNGTHNITAIVTANNGQTATSPVVNVEVSNTNSLGSNLVPNPLMETASSTTPGDPQDWSVLTWGSNTFTSSYTSTGCSAGDTKCLEINMTKYTSGDAKWAFTPQNVAQDTQYEFTDYYKSNVQTQVDAVFTMSDGTTEYEILGIPYANTAMTEFTSKFSVPYGAQTITIYHFIQSVGTLTIDDESIIPYTPVGFNRAIVSITIDDGYETAYSNALPILKTDGMTGTDFVITDLIGTSGYMTAPQLKTFTTDGDEMASHTVTHDNLTLETPAQLKTEMTQSQATLKTDTGVTPTDMAYPYGLYNTNVVTAVKSVYTAARGVESGLNSKDNFNAYDLKVEDVYTTTTTAQVADWVAQAQATKTWLIFVYHGVDTNLTTAVDSDEYCVTPTQFAAQLAAIKASGVTVETMAKAVAEVAPQV